MTRTTETDLTFEEELLVAVYFNNVEKLKWLMGMDYFKPSMVLEPVDFDEVSVPLYWLTICYHYILRYDEYNDVCKPVDEMLSVWKEKFHLDTDAIVDLKSCYHEDKMPPVIKDEDKWWMGHLTMEDFLRSGAREVDFRLYKAINAFNIKEIELCLQKGAAPDAKVIDKKGRALSALSMLRDRMDNRDYYLWGDEHVVDNWEIGSVVRKGLGECILFLLEKSVYERNECPVETYEGEVNLLGYVTKQFEPTQEMKEKINAFVREIDKPGAVLAVFDEGKVFARCSHLEYPSLYKWIIKKVFEESKYIRVRVGGYSDRVDSLVLNLAKDLPMDRVYVEHLAPCSADYEYKKRDPRIRIVGMAKYRFTSDMDIVKQAEEYDFKTFGNKNGMHTMVYYYVNNIDTGWYDENGEFCRFYSKERGLKAITDVAMINGFDEILPATAAICTFTFDTGGDEIYGAGFAHLDKRSRTSSQKMLIEKAGIKLLDITNK